MLSFAKCAPILGVALFTSLTPFTSLSAFQDAPKPTPPPVPPPLHLALTSLTPEATLAIGGDRQITAGGDAVWILSRAAGTLTRVDPKTNTIGTPITVGHEPCLSVVSAFGSLWTPLCGTKALARTPVPPSIDKPVIISVGIRSAGTAVSGASSVWMISDASGTLSRIDPDTNAVVAEITVAAGSGAMAFGDNSIWLTSESKDVLTRVNGDTNVVLETIKVGHGPVAVTTGVGSIWTLNGGDGTISRVDPKTNKVTQTIKVGITAKTGAIAVGEGSVWISAPGFPLTRVDPVTNTLAQQFAGAGGGALAIGHKSLWIAATPTAVWRVDPRRVEATRK
jgi:YVTN family beta-propeller protein